MASVVPAEIIESLPMLENTVRFYDWEFIAEGTHAIIYKAKDIQWGGSYCLKVFRSGWMTPFNLERTAYEYLKAAQIVEFIPHVYGYGQRTLPDWGLQVDDDSLYYAIVMEWLGNMRQLSPETVNIQTACNLLEGLSKIHKAGVLHDDSFRRNMMVMPGPSGKRAVWIDFSCAHVTRQSEQAQEFVLAAGTILEAVMSPPR
jgi:predicted Ser/Thr protein kinase